MNGGLAWRRNRESEIIDEQIIEAADRISKQPVRAAAAGCGTRWVSAGRAIADKIRPIKTVKSGRVFYTKGRRLLRRHLTSVSTRRMPSGRRACLRPRRACTTIIRFLRRVNLLTCQAEIDDEQIMAASVKTPCIGVCSTGIGDSVCRGCNRFAHEIINWNRYSEAERAAAYGRIEMLLTQVVKARVAVKDPARLRQKIDEQGLVCKLHTNDYTLAYEALRAFGGNLPNLAVLGLEAEPEWQSLSVRKLKNDIETNFYQLSCAHYQRYFPGHL